MIRLDHLDFINLWILWCSNRSGRTCFFFLHCEMCCSALTEAANGSINMPRHARLFALEPTSAVADGRINQTTWEHTSCNREMPKIQEQN